MGKRARVRRGLSAGGLNFLNITYMCTPGADCELSIEEALAIGPA